jgi:HTH-type transcriptional regulator/antitoxin HigA
MSTQRIAGVVAPGTHIRREMEARGWSQSDLAEILGRPIQAVNQILNGKKAITSITARGLEDATEIPAETWLNLESQYRLSLARRSDSAVTQRAELFSRAPVADMRRRGWVRDTRDIGKLKQDVLKFLRIKSLADGPQLRFAARKATSYESVSPEQEAWCNRAFQIAERMLNIPKFSKKRFEASLGELRRLGESVETVGQIPDALRKLGIRFVIVEHLPRTKIDGATFWLGKTSPVVVLSLRYGRIDYFLFTLFHELSHVRHQDVSIDNDVMDGGDATTISDCEIRANKEAGTFLVPPDELARFVSKKHGNLSKTDIVRFASTVGTHPGVVLGQLQHRGVVGWSACRDLLVPVRESIIEASVTDGWGK